MKHYIYALVDPETAEIFYVGRSTNPERRYTQHVRAARACAERLRTGRANYSRGMHRTWEIAHILNRGDIPGLVVLDTVEAEHFTEVLPIEGAWIEREKAAGHPLTNDPTYV